MKVREYKALARETLIGRYGTLIIAGILSAILVTLSSAITMGGLAAALNWSGALLGPDGNGLNYSFRGQNIHITSASAPNTLLMALGIIVFTIFLILTVILIIWLNIGKRKLMLNICRGNKYGVGDIFYGFSAEAHPFRVIFASIARFLIHNVVGLAIVLIFKYGQRMVAGAAPESAKTAQYVFIAVMVICALIQLNIDLGFSFAELSIIDRPETRVGAALGHSRKVTKGKKIQLIWMALFSFIFWYLLIGICHFTALWIMPYIRAAFTVMYLDGDGSAWQIPANRPSYQAAANQDSRPAAEAAVPAEKPALEAAAEEEKKPATPAPIPQAEEAPASSEVSESQPEASAQPVSEPVPEPAPIPEPEPVPEPEPAPAPEPLPEPGPVPVPEAETPAPEPVADAAPAPLPEQDPAAAPQPESAFDQWFQDAYKDVLNKKTPDAE